MAARKTVEVRYLVDRANYFLRESDNSQRGERIGTANMLELALHKANAYAGYQYLESAEVDHEAETFTCKDDSRRAYFLKGAPYPHLKIDAEREVIRRHYEGLGG